MLELTAVFEKWLIADGDYPPLYKGMPVKLSFCVESAFILPAISSEELSFDHLGNAEYNFCGEVLRIYNQESQASEIPLAIIDTGGFRFYIEDEEVKKLNVGERVKGKGTLLLDCYSWVEYYRFRNSPDIFFILEVTRIRKVEIPTRFIYRSPKVETSPTRVSPDNFENISDIDTMECVGSPYVFFLVNFQEINRKDVPLTFEM